MSSLDILIKKDPYGEWSPESGDHYLDLALESPEFEKLFFELLGCPAAEEYLFNEDIADYYTRQRELFQKHTPNYPMLGRICDMHIDIKYMPGEIADLTKECESVKHLFSDKEISALDKLLIACEIASSTNSGIFLACD